MPGLQDEVSPTARAATAKLQAPQSERWENKHHFCGYQCPFHFVSTPISWKKGPFQKTTLSFSKTNVRSPSYLITPNVGKKWRKHMNAFIDPPLAAIKHYQGIIRVHVAHLPLFFLVLKACVCECVE